MGDPFRPAIIFCVYIIACVALNARVCADRVRAFPDAWKKGGLVGAVLLAFLSGVSLFFGCLEDRWEKLFPDKWKLRAIEVWIVSLLVINMFLLFSGGIESHPAWILIPIFTVADVLHTLLSLFLAASAPKVWARSVLLLMVRYLQVVSSFACVYIWVQSLSPYALYSVHGVNRQLAPSEALYFSAVTAATVGFGDITPHLEAMQRLSLIVRPTTLVLGEIVCMIVITAIELPRLISSVRPPAPRSTCGGAC